MPHTVPNKPTNGAVEPTVARNARPLCSRLLMMSIARCRAMPTQVLRSSCLVCMVAWCAAASELFSATNRNALSSLSVATPSCTECACQNLSSASLPSFSIRLCSSTLMMPMYQEPTDMIMSMISVPLATKSPWRQSASRPYGFSTTSVVGPAAGGAGGLTSGGTGLTSIAAAGALSVLGACANASLELTTAAPSETSMTANRPTTSNGLSLIFPDPETTI